MIWVEPGLDGLSPFPRQTGRTAERAKIPPHGEQPTGLWSASCRKLQTRGLGPPSLPRVGPDLSLPGRNYAQGLVPLRWGCALSSPNAPGMKETRVPSPGGTDALEKRTATHSSRPAWRTPWTEEPGGLESMGSQKSWTGMSN